MAVLGWMGAAGILVGTGCYAPELRDCAVSCESSTECAPDQVCGSDRMCASPEVAGRCANPLGVVVDAAADSPVDAAMIDAGTVTAIDAPMIDAPPQPQQRWLRLEIQDRGAVTVTGIGACDHTAPMHICTFSVPAGMPTNLVAEPAPMYRFDKWEGPCANQDATCTFVPALALTEIKAKFKKL